MFLHRRQNPTADLAQQRVVSPRRICHQMMQRLVHPPDIVGSQSRRHRLDALAFAWQQKSGAVGFQRTDPVGMPCGLRQAVEVCRKAFLLWAGR
jgi:hypothetical protein